MDKLIELVKVIWRNPKVTLPILFLFFPSLAGNFWLLDELYGDPAKPVIVAEPLPAIQPFNGPYNEVVTLHSHPELSKEIDDKLKAHERGPLH